MSLILLLDDANYVDGRTCTDIQALGQEYQLLNVSSKTNGGLEPHRYSSCDSYPLTSETPRFSTSYKFATF